MKKTIKLEKNKKQDTTTSLVFQLTKNKTITNHIMSYVVNTIYYDYIKNTVHFECLHELQLFELATYSIRPNMPTDTSTFPNKVRMLRIHSYLIDHPITSLITVSYFICNRLESDNEYCSNWLFNINDNKHCEKEKLTTIINYFNKKCGDKLSYSYN